MASSSLPIVVLVADSQPLFLDSLARTIRQDVQLRLAADVDDGREALDAIRRLLPDVALVDRDMPTLNGRRVLDAVIRERLTTRVILLATDVRPDVALEAVAAGARGYLSKRVAGAAVCDAVRRVATGQAALCEELQTLLTGEIRRRYRQQPQLLSPRELEVLGLIAQGLSAPEMGRRLHLAPTTVKWYTAQIYERLGVGERAHAVAEAMRRGLLD